TSKACTLGHFLPRTYMFLDRSMEPLVAPRTDGKDDIFRNRSIVFIYEQMEIYTSVYELFLGLLKINKNNVEYEFGNIRPLVDDIFHHLSWVQNTRSSVQNYTRTHAGMGNGKISLIIKTWDIKKLEKK
ncbi:hypothetical protein ACJX0J_007995, partial [Zea mays]